VSGNCKDCQYWRHHVDGYGAALLVEDLYDEDDDFAAAINVLIDGFEYPDWSHKTVGEVLDKCVPNHGNDRVSKN